MVPESAGRSHNCEQTELPVQRIAERAGFGSAIAFRRQFAEIVGTTPARNRGTFRGGAQKGGD